MSSGVPGDSSSKVSRQHVAAELMATGGYTRRDIAEQIGVTTVTLTKWLDDPAFRRLVSKFRSEIHAKIRATGIASKTDRLLVYEEDFRKLDEVIEARAKAFSGEPMGLHTGLVLVQEKNLRDTDGTYVTVHEYSVDTSLIDTRLKILRQMAQERGEWETKAKVDGDMRIEVVYADGTTGFTSSSSSTDEGFE